MKKLLVLAAAMLFMGISALQAQSVSINYDDITTTSITATYTPTGCDSYYYYTAGVGESDMWVMMMGGIENVVRQFGIHATAAETHTFTDFTPGTDYVFYTLAVAGDNKVLATDTVATLSQGGAGTAELTIYVGSVMDTSCITVVSPNENTLKFKYFIIMKDTADNLGDDAVIDMLMDYPYEFYEEDIWTWLTLTELTEYYVVGIAQNSANEWGPLAKEYFKTLSTSEIEAVDNAKALNLSIYPNPTADMVYVEGIAEGENIAVFNAGGQLVATSSNGTVNMSAAEDGIYFVCVTGTGRAKVAKLTVKH